ncbi:hypothetical protein J3R83DRAFT_10803 [Lanmaoa asiatica]|nr:hypothetical protein J3R83DRAFT_10803 [Lanmaoa asiatica]
MRITRMLVSSKKKKENTDSSDPPLLLHSDRHFFPTSYPCHRVRNLACTVAKCLGRMQSHCIVCYFLRTPKPIRVILTHPRGGEWEEFDSHTCDPFKCPWQCFNPRSAYMQFESEVGTSLRASKSGSDWCTVCTICGEPWDYSCYHERCIYGDRLFMLAYLVWEHRPSRDRVFSFIHHNAGLQFPEFNGRGGYAIGWGSASLPLGQH